MILYRNEHMTYRNAKSYIRCCCIYNMATAKDAKEETTTTLTSTTKLEREQQQAVYKTLDKARDEIKRSVFEARKEIPRYTQIVNDYEIICYNLFSIFGKTILKSPKLGTLIKNIANCLT